MQKNTTGQKLIVFAFDRTDNTPVTGDASNITANLRKDNGSAVATNDVNPTETEDGFYAFDLTQAETNADVMQCFPASVTADVQVIAVPGVIYTTPNKFGDDIIQTADNDVKISLIPTTPMRGTDSANTVVPPSVAQFNARTILSADYFDPAADTVANVTLVATTTTNTDMRGTNSALLAASYTAPDNAGITQTQADIAALNDISVSQILTTQMTESYAADGIAPTLAQSLFLTMQNLQDYTYIGTTQTVKKIDGSATAATYTLDDAVNPTSKTRAS